MVQSLRVEVVGVEKIQRLLKRIKTTAKKEEDEIGLAARKFVENFWKPIMPVISGFMKNTSTSLQQGKGKAIAFTQTSQNTEGGYAIFPELRGQSPRFTERAVEAFTQKHFQDAEIKIDKAIKR